MDQLELLYSFGDVEPGNRWFDMLRDLAVDQTVRTDLCDIMTRHGSDKGKGWHNYTQVYARIFAGVRHDVRTILEVGLGTNHTDVPSNMGVDGRPGASHRGWREYFPAASVFGADVDRRVLFQEDRIRTFYVDQLKPDTVADLAETLAGVKFDIIIDDGLHLPDPARNLLAGVRHLLKVRGLYIIEDVVMEPANFEKYKTFLPLTGMAWRVYRVPNPVNDYDNCLAFGCWV